MDEDEGERGDSTFTSKEVQQRKQVCILYLAKEISSKHVYYYVPDFGVGHGMVGLRSSFATPQQCRIGKGVVTTQ